MEDVTYYRIRDNLESLDIMGILYSHLVERLSNPIFNISHKRLPLFTEHVAFVNNNPYSEWYIIYSDGQPVGNFYITNKNEVGIYIANGHRGCGLGKGVIDFLKKNNHFPIEYYANINPANAPSIKLFTSAGFELVQQTYRLRA